MAIDAPTRRAQAMPDSLKRLGYKIRRFGPLPRGFNPLTATDEQLADHRLPRRPDPQTEPKLLALWERSMTQTKTWIAPEFAEVKGRVGPSPVLPRPIASGELPLDPPPPDIEYENWSGAMRLATAGQTYTFVAAQWTVPDPVVDWGKVIFSDDWIAAEWVGIDGPRPSKDLLQAGTAIQPFWDPLFGSTTAPKIDVWAWWEWVPNSPVGISNVVVSPRDVVVCLVCADDTMAGATIYFTNLTTGRGTRFHVTPPSGTKLVGSTAEWIVERPTIYPGWPESWWESPYLAELPDYVECDFDDCVAGGPNLFVDLDGADTVTMVSANGDILSQPQIVDDVTLKVSWRRSS